MAHDIVKIAPGFDVLIGLGNAIILIDDQPTPHYWRVKIKVIGMGNFPSFDLEDLGTTLPP